MCPQAGPGYNDQASHQVQACRGELMKSECKKCPEKKFRRGTLPYLVEEVAEALWEEADVGRFAPDEEVEGSVHQHVGTPAAQA